MTQWDVLLTCENKVATEIYEVCKKWETLCEPSIRISRCGTVTEFFWSQVAWVGMPIEEDIKNVLQAFDKLESPETGYFFIRYNDYDESYLRRHPFNEASPLSHSWLCIESDDFSAFDSSTSESPKEKKGQNKSLMNVIIRRRK